MARGYRPILRNEAGGILRVSVSSYMPCIMEWILQSSGIVQILSGHLDLQGSGDITSGKVSVASSHSLWLGSGAMQMMQPAVQELKLTVRVIEIMKQSGAPLYIISVSQPAYDLCVPPLIF